MDIVPDVRTSSAKTIMTAPITDTADIFESKWDSEWQMMGWHVGTTGGAAIYHRRGCPTCSTYTAHLMAAYEKDTVKLPKKVIGQAINMAWPDFVNDINNAANEQ